MSNTLSPESRRQPSPYRRLVLPLLAIGGLVASNIKLPSRIADARVASPQSPNAVGLALNGFSVFTPITCTSRGRGELKYWGDQPIPNNVQTFNVSVPEDNINLNIARLQDPPQSAGSQYIDISGLRNDGSANAIITAKRADGSVAGQLNTTLQLPNVNVCNTPTATLTTPTATPTEQPTLTSSPNSTPTNSLTLTPTSTTAPTATTEIPEFTPTIPAATTETGKSSELLLPLIIK